MAEGWNSQRGESWGRMNRGPGDEKCDCLHGLQYTVLSYCIMPYYM